MQLLAVASEAFPLIKTGGLADVVGALPAALGAEGVSVRTLLPGYPAVLAALGPAAEVARIDGMAVRAGLAGGLDLLVLDAPALFGRAGNPYLASDGTDWPDNAQRFAALSRAGAAIATGAVPGFAPEVVHAHDWQAGLVPAFLAHGGRPAPPCVFTVHNMAFGGLFPAGLLTALGLPHAAFAVEGLEFYGRIGFLKAGLHYADHVTTVSPTYAEEILTEEGGMGYAGVLRARAGSVSGILNGIDTAVWDPARDPALAAPFDAADVAGRAACRAALAEEFGLESDGIVFGAVTRLTEQKGVDLLVAALPDLLEAGGRLALLGAGDATFEAVLREAALRHPGRIGVRIGYDEAVAHRIQGGADVLLVPSRFEPCGLTQLCALRYGAIPLVARVGGLADTVVDANPAGLAAGVATGFQFAPVTAEAFARTLRKAAGLFADRAAWTRLQASAMRADVSWAGPARAYAALFRRPAQPA